MALCSLRACCGPGALEPFTVPAINHTSGRSGERTERQLSAPLRQMLVVANFLRNLATLYSLAQRTIDAV